MKAKKDLVRGIGRWDLVGILINGTVGAGIFGLPARLYAAIGVYSIPAWILCAALVALIALCFAEVASRFDQTGGPYLFVRVAFGPLAGFLIGWIGWTSRAISYAVVCNLAVIYIAGFEPSLAAGAPRFFTVTAITIALTAVTLLGVRQSTFASNAFTVTKLAVLLGFVAVGLPRLAASGLPHGALPSATAFQSALMMAMVAFLGFDAATVNSGEMKTPRRDAPFALGVGIAITAMLYVLVQMVCVAIVSDLGSSDRPIAEGAIALLGPVGGYAVMAGAIVTMLGTLMVLLIVGSRMPFAMAEHGQLPRVLAAIHPRFRTPHIAILIHAALSWTLAVTGSFAGFLAITALTRLITYVATCAALMALRSHDSGTAATPFRVPGFRVPGGRIVAVVAIAASLWLMLGTRWSDALGLAAIAAIGLLIGRVVNRRPTARATTQASA